VIQRSQEAQDYLRGENLQGVWGKRIWAKAGRNSSSISLLFWAHFAARLLFVLALWLRNITGGRFIKAALDHRADQLRIRDIFELIGFLELCQCLHKLIRQGYRRPFHIRHIFHLPFFHRYFQSGVLAYLKYQKVVYFATVMLHKSTPLLLFILVHHFCLK
jgi:hypothetical protein